MKGHKVTSVNTLLWWQHLELNQTRPQVVPGQTSWKNTSQATKANHSRPYKVKTKNREISRGREI
jgi:hypothetical protein